VASCVCKYIEGFLPGSAKKKKDLNVVGCIILLIHFCLVLVLTHKAYVVFRFFMRKMPQHYKILSVHHRGLQNMCHKQDVSVNDSEN
jgi:hypothetical protein